MSGGEAFHAVAAQLGIETRHTDALGVIHAPDAETLAAMVSAFGLPAKPDQAAAALTDLQAASISRLVQAVRTSICLPTDAAAACASLVRK